jgi:nucleoside phosphorylase
MTNDLEFTRLHRRLVAHYSLDELRTLCAQLAVPFDDLGGEGRQAKARELILWLVRRARLPELIACLETNTGSGSEGEPRPPELGRVDLAIVTAMPEELEPVLGLIGGRENWEAFEIDRYVHYRARFGLKSGALNVIACTLWKYGGHPTTAEILRLKALRPRLIAMTGICAGWESKGIHFGDVMVAERAFHANEGKLTAQGFEPDTRTYQPPPWLLQWLGDFSSNIQWASTIRTPRPRSLRYQIEWLLCQIAGRGPSFPESAEDWRKVKANRIDYPRARKFLLDNGLLIETGALTELALSRLDHLRRQSHGKLMPRLDPRQPTAHYGAFASTEAIIAVEHPFLEHSQRIRKVRAVELEVASLFAAAAEIGVPAFAVKGVSDYGTPDKDDAFHKYAAEVSARWMYQFVQTYSHLLVTIS